MKYRLKDGYIEAEHKQRYVDINLGPGTRWVPVSREDFEYLFEPVPESEPAPPPSEEPESEWKPYAIAMRAEDEGFNYIQASHCLARSDDEAVGIAHRRSVEKWPIETHSEHQVTAIRLPSPEDH